MKPLVINYNTPLNKVFKEDNVKTLNKKILTVEDLNVVDNNIKNKEFIIIKNDKLKMRSNFDLDNLHIRLMKDRNDIDLFILSSYQEKCRDLKKEDSYDDYTFFKSRTPGEIEAFAIRSDKWENFKKSLENSKEEKINSKIKNLVYNEEYDAVFLWPPAFFYEDDFRLMQTCRQEKESLISPRIKELSFYWFMITFLFTIVFMYLIYNKIPKDRFFYLSNKNSKSQ